MSVSAEKQSPCLDSCRWERLCSPPGTRVFQAQLYFAILARVLQLVPRPFGTLWNSRFRNQVIDAQVKRRRHKFLIRVHVHTSRIFKFFGEYLSPKWVSARRRLWRIPDIKTSLSHSAGQRSVGVNDVSSLVWCFALNCQTPHECNWISLEYCESEIEPKWP